MQGSQTSGARTLGLSLRKIPRSLPRPHPRRLPRCARSLPRASNTSPRIFIMSRLSLALLAIAGTLTAPVLASEGDRSVVLEWNAQLEATIPASAGPTLPRYYSMMHIAMFDSVNSIEGGYSPYRTRVPARRFASSEAAAAQAAHDVLVSLLPAQAPAYDALLSQRLARIQQPCAEL